ncbi:MAG: 2-amino-4-hydroxy-6-hydroxymethyldihydropteridine diphosphokinase [Deltaproteobacteria bacterium]|nr:2-amino-4-hydroxy-6-hydroxymethyldihydropteridine diphosphokinase [Deltaproteobacteria bacterium]
MSAFVVAVGASGPMAERRVAAAVALLREQPALAVLGVSDGYGNPAVGGVTLDRFVNACLVVETALAPRALLEALRGVEARLGRVRGPKDGARALDLDLVLGLALVAPVVDPDVPHPRALARDFVVLPALQALARAGLPAPAPLVEAGRRLSFGARLLPVALEPS